VTPDPFSRTLDPKNDMRTLLTILLGSALVACSGDESAADATPDVISQEEAEAVAEDSIQNEDDAMSALDAMENEIGDGY
jgi:nitrous oxide reductase accessory protein NosL